MPQMCKVCAHRNRYDIDVVLAQRKLSERDVAKRYGLTTSSVHRHAANHLPTMLAALASRVDAIEGHSILTNLVGLYERTMANLAEAESFASDSDRAKAVPALIREARATIDSLTRVSVALAQANEHGSAEHSSELSEALTEALNRVTDRRQSHARNGATAQAPPLRELLAAASPDSSATSTSDDDIADAEIVSD